MAEKMRYDLTTEEIPVKTLEGCKINITEFLKENKDWINTTKNYEESN